VGEIHRFSAGFQYLGEKKYARGPSKEAPKWEILTRQARMLQTRFDKDIDFSLESCIIKSHRKVSPQRGILI